MAALMAVCVGASSHAAAQADASGLLDSLERGRWQLRSVGSSAASLTVSQLCLGESRYLAQIQHGSTTQCSHFVVKSTPSSVTISYSCKGAGQGLTTIRKENDRLVQIQSQGIHNGSPFSFSAEARRTGPC
ncbi:hypothetical protein DXH95_09705 [Sphingorhabdus pulchriflava]|uniref:Uncharacterized protein n=2 Tax=Sphingorhabdus pulchriflava TaxID=2292257 RepID=A0A371BJ29_9SPHN|nr:hypothetical protein DXH95_09705 [Sphingorhabdus pulchriflava]